MHRPEPSGSDQPLTAGDSQLDYIKVPETHSQHSLHGLLGSAEILKLNHLQAMSRSKYSCTLRQTVTLRCKAACSNKVM